MAEQAHTFARDDWRIVECRWRVVQMGNPLALDPAGRSSRTGMDMGQSWVGSIVVDVVAGLVVDVVDFVGSVRRQLVAASAVACVAVVVAAIGPATVAVAAAECPG